MCLSMNVYCLASLRVLSELHCYLEWQNIEHVLVPADILYLIYVIITPVTVLAKRIAVILFYSYRFVPGRHKDTVIKAFPLVPAKHRVTE